MMAETSVDIIPDKITGLYTLFFQNKTDLRWEAAIKQFSRKDFLLFCIGAGISAF